MLEYSDETDDPELLLKPMKDITWKNGISAIACSGQEKKSTITKNGTTQKDQEAAFYDPFTSRNVPHPTSDFETFVHLLKGSLGTGMLAMPMAFKNSGLFVGLVGSIVVGYVCTYCVHMFVRASHVLCHRHQLPAIGFQKIVELSFLEGPECLKKFSKAAGYVINFGLLTELLGVCSAYVLFVAKSMKQIVEYYWHVDLSVQVYMAIMLPVLVTINLTRNLRHLTPLSMISNVLFLLGVFVSFYYIFEDLPPISSRPASFSSWGQLPLFFGTTIFALEGIGVVMPLENNMKNPKHFISCPGVLHIGMLFLIILYAITGFFGYLKYGDKVEASITLNLPVETMLGQFLKTIVAIAVFLTYFLLFYAAMDLLGIVNGRRFKTRPLLKENIVRILTVLGTVVVAGLFPNLGPFLSLIGAFSLCVVGLIFPPIIDTLIYYKEGLGRLKWRLGKNAIILSCGVLGLVTGTMISLQEFVESMGGS